jgi:hypothetical protein
MNFWILIRATISMRAFLSRINAVLPAGPLQLAGFAARRRQSLIKVVDRAEYLISQGSQKSPKRLQDCELRDDLVGLDNNGFTSG